MLDGLIDELIPAAGFAELPPEVNSGWIHAGPGAGSMQAAAMGWDRLAAELSSSAASCHAVISGLTEEIWQGPASAAMAFAAVRYATWMTMTAEQARRAADQARAAAAAFQRAYATTVPPAVIAANRAMLTKLVATNILGQNSVMIAANEAQYSRMWAQDAASMYAYAHASAAAATLTPFTAPPQHTDRDDAAVSQAETISGAQPVANALQQLATGGSIVGTLQQINTFLETNPLYQAMSQPVTILGHLIDLPSAAARIFRAPTRWIGPVYRHWFPLMQGGEPASSVMSDVSGDPLRSTLVGSRGSSAPAAGVRGGQVSAGLGRSSAVGSLSVPRAWGASIELTSTAWSSPMEELVGSLPAGIVGPTDCYDGMLPAASLLEAPRAAATSLQNGSRAPFASQQATGPGAHRPSERIRLGWGIPGVADSLSDHERAELEALRKRLAEMMKRRDEATRTIRNAIRS